MAKNSAYGISTVKLADPVAGSFPTSFDGFEFKAIVIDSLTFNDAEPTTNDIYVEETDDIYATLTSEQGTKGFTMQTYDLSAEAFQNLLGYTTSGAWNIEPTTSNNLIKAVEIVTRTLDDIPSMTFQWAKMDIKVTKSGNIAKSGFPNLNLTFKQLANYDSDGKAQPGARNGLTSAITAAAE